MAAFPSHTRLSGGGDMGRRKRRRVDPTDDWQQLELLCVWEEQREYERIRPLVLFGGPVPERSAETGALERVLYRKIAAFRKEGMVSLFSPPKAKRRVLPLAIRRKIVDLKAEHPPLNLEEIANICGTLFGRRPDGQTVKAVLEESAIPASLSGASRPTTRSPTTGSAGRQRSHCTWKAGRTRASRATWRWTGPPPTGSGGASRRKARRGSETGPRAGREAWPRWTSGRWSRRGGCRRTPSSASSGCRPPWNNWAYT